VGARRQSGDVVKQQVAAHWNRRAPGFDTDFGHSVRTAAERAAWDRILDLVLPGRAPLDALDAGAPVTPAGGARGSEEYRAIGDQLPFLGGRAREEIEKLLSAHGLVRVGSDPLADLVAAQAQRMVDEGLERRTHRRFVVWGDVVR